MGRSITLAEIRSSIGRLGLVVTGASVITVTGLRVGKGHGFFDVEWAVLYSVGAADRSTPAAALVHDCQVVEEAPKPAEFDTVVDVIFTPTRTLEVADAHKPTVGIVWQKIETSRLEENMALQELKALQEVAM